MVVANSRPIAGIYWLAGAVALTLGAWFVCQEPNCAATRLDTTLMNWFADRRSAFADQFFRIVTGLGSIVTLGPLVIVGMLKLKFDRRIREAYFLGLALAGTVVIMHLSKLVIARPRPSDAGVLVDMPWDQSFPSAHSAQIASVMLCLAIVLARSNHPASRWLLVLATLSVVLVGLSRVYLQVHYPTDVLVGVIVGLMWVAGLACWMLPQAKTRRDDHA